MWKCPAKANSFLYLSNKSSEYAPAQNTQTPVSFFKASSFWMFLASSQLWKLEQITVALQWVFFGLLCYPSSGCFDTRILEPNIPIFVSVTKINTWIIGSHLSSWHCIALPPASSHLNLQYPTHLRVLTKCFSSVSWLGWAEAVWNQNQYLCKGKKSVY